MRPGLIARAAATLLAAAVLIPLLAACGGSADAVAERREASTLAIGEFPWSAANATNAVLAEIVAQHPELGIRRVERVRVNPEEGWKRLERGELDVLTEVYIPNQQPFASEARDAAELVHRTYSGAVNAWYVPAYAVAPGGPAAGLRSVDELERFEDVFDRTLFDGEAGWVTTEQNEQRIEGFGLELEQRTGTEAELVAALERRYASRRPILLYLWRPHWAHSAFDLVELEEPNAYSVECFTGSKRACAMPTNDVWIAARRDLAERAPRMQALLSRFEIPIDDLEQMLVEIDRNGRRPRSVARDWVRRNADAVESWLEA